MRGIFLFIKVFQQIKWGMSTSSFYNPWQINRSGHWSSIAADITKGQPDIRRLLGKNAPPPKKQSWKIKLNRNLIKFHLLIWKYREQRNMLNLRNTISKIQMVGNSMGQINCKKRRAVAYRLRETESQCVGLCRSWFKQTTEREKERPA